jgi:TRAP-type C4-dicarboxylate transport system permease small subunit
MLKFAYKVYCRIEEIFVGLCFFGVVGLTFMNAVLRTFGKPIVTAEDMCLLLFPWAAFVGADVAFRYSRLVGMDMLVNKLPPKTQKSIQLLVFTIMIGALIFFIPYGFRLAASNWNRVMNSLPVSYGFVTISLPVSCFLMIFTAILKIKKVIANFNNDLYEIKKDNPDLVGDENTGMDITERTKASALKAETP